MSRVLKKPAAVRDLIANGRHIAASARPSVFWTLPSGIFAELGRHPEIGRQRRFQRRPGLRSWYVDGFDSYLIFYRPIAEGVEIYRVLHGARDLRRLLTRRPRRQP